jgi:hypothetical protein
MKQSYQSLYESFDSPLMSQLRLEAYGEDIGQHSWVTAEDLRSDAPRLKLTPAARLLDLGCGPCGPLTFLMRMTGCSGVGLDLSRAALSAAGLSLWASMLDSRFARLISTVRYRWRAARSTRRYHSM